MDKSGLDGHTGDPQKSSCKCSSQKLPLIGWSRPKTDQNGSSTTTNPPRFASESWYSRCDFSLSMSVSWSRTKSCFGPGVGPFYESSNCANFSGLNWHGFVCHHVSLGWLKGESTGNQRSCVKGFPVNFPVTQFGLHLLECGGQP